MLLRNRESAVTCTYMYMYTSLPVQEFHSSSSGEYPLEMGEGSERVLPSISSYPTVTDTTKREGSRYSKRTDYQIHQLSLYTYIHVFA